MFVTDVLQKHGPPGPLLSKNWGSGPPQPPVNAPMGYTPVIKINVKYEKHLETIEYKHPPISLPALYALAYYRAKLRAVCAATARLLYSLGIVLLA